MAAEVSTPMGPAPVIPVILIGAGFYLAWFGIHYFKSDVKYPTDPIKAVLQGKPLPKATGTPTDTQAEITSALTKQQQALQANTGTATPADTGTGQAGPAPPNSGNYDVPSLEALWVSQGGSGQTSFEAANVAMAESGGRPAVTSSNPDGGTNVGLWQLDTRGVGAGYTVAQLSDPATNARITIMNTANGTTWHQWADAVVVGGVYIGPKV